jgi:hypothetical protein
MTLEPQGTVPTLLTDPPLTGEFVVVIVYEIGVKLAVNVRFVVTVKE